MNRSEEIVFQVCRRSFLSLWSYANPQVKRGRELCDVLVVCEPDVIILSVKEVTAAPSMTLTEWDRWERKAIEKSVRQVYGAARRLSSAASVFTSDGSTPIALPPAENRRVHRVAVALGGKGKLPLSFGDFGKGCVHVLDEKSFWVILHELDTVTDVVNYFIAKEGLAASEVETIIASEEDLLAIYLHRNRRFPEGRVLAVEEGSWEGFSQKAEYQAKKKADRLSYLWDEIIEYVSNHLSAGTLEYDGHSRGAELALRTMAREDRFSRRLLGKAFDEFYRSSEKQPLARCVPAASGVVYVFLALPKEVGRAHRQRSLCLRCFVARGMFPESRTVVGIATEQHDPKGFSFDVVYLHKPEWTPEDEEHATGIKSDLGYFADPRMTHMHEDEYPSS